MAALPQLEVEDVNFDFEGQDINMMSEILSSPQKIIITTETTEKPLDFTGRKRKKKTKEEIDISDIMQENQLMANPEPQFMAGPPPMRLPVAPPMGQPMQAAPMMGQPMAPSQFG
tara:strand:+ start:24 stop:368 length:345 start_codon:yes stop_codon:yes gene_type:complete